MITYLQATSGSLVGEELVRRAIHLVSEKHVSAESITLLTSSPAKVRRLQQMMAEQAEGHHLDDLVIPVLTVDNYVERTFRLALRSNPTYWNQWPNLTDSFDLLSDLQATILVRSLLIQSEAQAPVPKAALESMALASQVERQFQLWLAHGLWPSEATRSLELSTRIQWLWSVYTLFIERCLAKNALPHELPLALLAVASKQKEVQPQYGLKALLAEDVQEWSPLHHQVLQATCSSECHLIVAGNPELALRFHRGATPAYLKRYTVSESLSSDTEAFSAFSLLQHTLKGALLPTAASDCNAEAIKKAVQFGVYDTFTEETGALTNRILRDKSQHGLKWSEMAILLAHSPDLSNPTHRALHDALVLAGIPNSLSPADPVQKQLQVTLAQGVETLALFNAPSVNAEQLQLSLRAWLVSWIQCQPTTEHFQDELYQQLEQLLPDESMTCDELESVLAVNTKTENLTTLALPLAFIIELSKSTNRLPMMLCQDLLGFITQQRTDLPPEIVEALTKRFCSFVSTVESLLDKPLTLHELQDALLRLWPNFQKDQDGTADQVQVGTITMLQGQSVSRVYAPCQTNATEQPTVLFDPTELAPLTAFLVPESQAILLEPVLKARQIYRRQEQLALLNQVTDSLWLSTHLNQDRGVVEPSASYTRLLFAHRTLLHQLTGQALADNTLCRICDCLADPAVGSDHCGVDDCSRRTQVTNVQHEGTQSDWLTVTSKELKSAWGSLRQQTPNPLWTDDDVITLSPSAIQDYVLCPRKFYYGRVLRVHTEQNQAASIGILIHRLMEVFNQLYGQTPEQYTPEHLMRLKTELFDTMPLSQDSHFTENDRNRLESLEPLARSDLEKRVTAALEDMIAKGYFSRPVRRVFPEVRLSGWKLPGVDNTVFTVVLDALIERTDGSWDVLDYKFYNDSQFNATKDETRQKYLMAVLEPFAEEAESHDELFKTTNSKPRLYQLPLAYLAVKHCNSSENPAYGHRVNDIALQIVRPASGKKPEIGANAISFPVSVLEKFEDAFIEDLNAYIAQPIRTSSYFSTSPGSHCGLCGYRPMCDAGTDNELAEEGGYSTDE